MKFLPLIFLLASTASASPYFRPIDLAHIQQSGGIFYGPDGQGQAGTMVALITHSTKDGCFFPSVVCEDWSPLTFGGTFTGPNKILAIGPSVNLAQIFKAAGLFILDAVTKQETLREAKDTLARPQSEGIKLSLSINWAYAPAENKGYVKFFIGPAWRF